MPEAERRHGRRLTARPIGSHGMDVPHVRRRPPKLRGIPLRLREWLALPEDTGEGGRDDPGRRFGHPFY